MKSIFTLLLISLPALIFGQTQEPLVGFVIVDSDNKQVVKFDPSGKTGYKWYYIDLVKYTPEVLKLHNIGRKFGREGKLKEGIKNMEMALAKQKKAPTILYDLAYTYMMNNDSINALRCYKLLDNLIPDGYFLNKTYIKILEDEIAGKLPKGFCLIFTQIEDSPKSEKKVKYLEELLKVTNNYPPLVKEYLKAIDNSARYESLINETLKKDVDPETRGFLLNALANMYIKTNIDQSVKYWNNILEDTKSTTQWKELAKFFLSGYCN